MVFASRDVTFTTQPGNQGLPRCRSSAWAGETTDRSADKGAAPVRWPGGCDGEDGEDGEDRTAGSSAPGSGLGWGAEAVPPLPRAGADGPRTRDEPAEARQARQSPAGAVEGAIASVHRASIPEEIRPGTASVRHPRREVAARWAEGGTEGSRGMNADKRQCHAQGTGSLRRRHRHRADNRSGHAGKRPADPR